jgi:hypothetical protein
MSQIGEKAFSKYTEIKAGAIGVMDASMQNEGDRHTLYAHIKSNKSWLLQFVN